MILSDIFTSMTHGLKGGVSAMGYFGKVEVELYWDKTSTIDNASSFDADIRIGGGNIHIPHTDLDKAQELGIAFLPIRNGRCTYEGLSRAQIELMVLTLAHAAGTPVVSAPTVSVTKEKPCKVCGRKNDIGIATCYWCGTSDPTA
jgi:hypothetical protein